MTTEEIRAAWLSRLQSTLPADRSRAEAAVQRLYSSAGFSEPRFVLWFDSPCAASWPVALLSAEGNRAWAPLLAPSALTPEERDRAERTRADLGQHVGASTWNEVVQAVGQARVGTLLAMPDPSLLFSSALLDARFSIVDDVSALFKLPDDDDALARAEQYLRGGNHGVLISGLHCATTGSVIGNSFFTEYSFSMMADDEVRVSGRPVPDVLAAAWEIGRSAHLFWPFENAVFLCEWPQELHWNARNVPHSQNGPAIVYRDGWRVFAWNGQAVPERWIMEPEAVPPRDYKGFDPTFRTFAESKGTPTKKTSKRGTPSSIVKAVLPADPTARIEQLRSHAGGQLPRFDRYQSGAHREVWNELVSLGPDVREESHAADALAVAYETMSRVERNVRTLVRRLAEMKYVFTPDGQSTGSSIFRMFRGSKSAVSRAHVPPSADAAQRVADFEREFGTLPLSLRAFYEVVGEVNFIGTHPAIDPSNNPVAPDPLLVYGLQEGIVEFDDDEDGEEEGSPAAVTIAPDDLHKANTSGGDAYEMAIPDLRADGELLNERHNLFFVDYLRLAFRFGGFPGYEGRSVMPKELEQLAADLIEF